MNHRKPSTNSDPTPASGMRAVLAAFHRVDGSGAPPYRRLAVLAILALAAALSLAASAASAAVPNFCPPGSGAGQCDNPVAVAVDQSTGSPTSGYVYIGDENNRRIDVFDSAGHFIRAFGFGVLNGAKELQTCTTSCVRGLSSYPGDGGVGPRPGAITPNNLAVDPTSHDVYAFDGRAARVEKYTPAGEFSLMFGGGVLDGGATGTANLTAGSATLTSVATTSREFAVGQTVTGAGIPAATRITALGINEQKLTLSKPVTASGTTVALTAPTPAANVPNNEVQSIAIGGAPTGGTFTLQVLPPPPDFVSVEATPKTGPIPFNASAAEVQSSLQALSTVGPGNAAVSGPAGGPYAVEFKGTRYADTNLGSLLADAAGLTPSGTVTVTTTVQGASAPETCTKAELEAGDTCGAGAPGPGPGQFSRENEPLAFDSSGNLWVGDKDRLEQFSPEGEYLSEVSLPGAGEVNGLAVDPFSGDFYTLKPSSGEQNETQQIIPPASGEGEFTLTFGGDTTAPISAATRGRAEAIQVALEQLPSIGPGNVQVTFATVTFTGAFASTDVEQITASAGTSVETTQQGTPGTPGVLSKRKPSGELIETLDASGHPAALGLDPAGRDLFVSDQRGVTQNRGNATLLEFDPSGAQTEAFGSGEVIGAPHGNALAFGDSAQRLYATEGSAAQAFALPPPGPLPGAGTTVAKEVRKTSATLCAKVNPEGAATTARFEYITAAEFEENEEAGHDGFTGALQTPESASLGSDFQPHELCQPVALAPATAYRFRLLAHNANGTVPGETASLQTLPPAAIDAVAAADVSAESATLLAQINPLGDATSYHFEFLTEAAYQANLQAELDPFTGAAQAPLQPAPLGAGNADVAVSQHLQGLVPRTVYRYRVVVANAVSEANGGPFPSPVHAFTTQTPGALSLPDHRAWELVSPADKHGARLNGIGAVSVVQAAASGGAISYPASAPTEAEPAGSPNQTQVLSARGPAGWSSRDLNAPHEANTGVQTFEYRYFSTDLSLGLLQPKGAFVPSLSPQASEQTPYLRTNFSSAEPAAFCTESCYRPLATGCPPEGEACSPAVEAAADVPPGTVFGGEPGCRHELTCGPKFAGASPDLGHVVFSSSALALTPGGKPGEGLWEWSSNAPPAAALQPVTVLPGGEPVQASEGASLGFQGSNARNAISSDGSRVVFSTIATGHLYLRDIAHQETLQLDAIQGGPGAAQTPAAHFQLASADGSRVFFTDSQQLTPDAGRAANGGDLYEYDLERPLGQRLADLTPNGSSGEGAGVQRNVLGASQDGSSLYFIADGVLAPGASPGDCSVSITPTQTCNLYLRRDGATTFIATLSGEDQGDWETQLVALTARVSPDGRWLAFMSQRSLTGYDNRDAVSGVPDQEVFLYHAPAGEAGAGSLLCVSCNPTGARPHGVEFGPSGENLPLVAGGTSFADTAWLAANIPGWTGHEVSRALYQPRYLSDSGRLFFNSSDALVPQDSNGQEDVYTYEPPQGGEAEPSEDTCTESSPTYNPATQGCVSLISSGASKENSAFIDASESGTDVFFLTAARLDPGRDADTSLDVYDARSGGGFPEPVKPVECVGDACQPPAVPPNDPTPGSLTFHGAGNVTECPKGEAPKGGKCVKHKAKRKHHKKKHKRPAKSKRGTGR
ncbi:MAG: hypothetical protein JWM24_2004 [Solirubrobacterales bacterium]|nr:hypothetical protein [Solirubrobacterales bacterium]